MGWLDCLHSVSSKTNCDGAQFMVSKEKLFCCIRGIVTVEAHEAPFVLDTTRRSLMPLVHSAIRELVWSSNMLELIDDIRLTCLSPYLLPGRKKV
jgi:hypothetical protein